MRKKTQFFEHFARRSAKSVRKLCFSRFSRHFGISNSHRVKTCAAPFCVKKFFVIVFHYRLQLHLCHSQAIIVKWMSKLLSYWWITQYWSEKTVMNFFQKLHDSLKTEIADVIKGNVELRRSLDLTQDKLDESTEVIKRHEAKFRQLNENSDLSERVRSLEDYSRSSNIIIDGIPETNDESNERLQVDISKILSEKMNVTPKISTCHRIGNKTPSRNRPIIVKLSSQDDRNKCLRNAPKLKGTNIFINEDVSNATQEIRRTKMPELMEKRKAGMIAYFSGTRIVTRSQQAQPSTQREQRAADFPCRYCY